jgi:hypothetical protein
MGVETPITKRTLSFSELKKIGASQSHFAEKLDLKLELMKAEGGDRIIRV